MLTTIEIGRRIAQARKDKDYSQAQIANRLAISPQAVGKWERGESLPDIITLDRLGKLLGVGLAYFSESYVSANDRVPGTEKSSDEPDRQKREPSVTFGEEMAWDFSHEDWQDSDFSGMKSLAKTLKGANILRCIFAESDLRELQMNGNNIVGTSFLGSDISGAIFKGSNVEHNDFSGCLLMNAKFHSCMVNECKLNLADLSGAAFDACSLVRCENTGSRWYRTLFKNTQLKGMIFNGDMEACYFDNCDFSNVEFRGAHLVNTCFKGKGMKKLRLTNCTTDNITYAFLKNGKVDLSDVTITD